MSGIDKVYSVLRRDGFFYLVMYWLALPVLTVVFFLVKDKSFNPKQWAIYYILPPYMPADPLEYEEYLQVQKYIVENPQNYYTGSDFELRGE